MVEGETQVSAVTLLVVRSLSKRSMVNTALRITIGIEHVIGGGGARQHNAVAEVVREYRLTDSPRRSRLLNGPVLAHATETVRNCSPSLSVYAPGRGCLGLAPPSALSFPSPPCPMSRICV